MRLAITGGSGLVGQAVVASWLRQGDHVIGLTRRPGQGGYPDGVEEVAWDPAPWLQHPPAAAPAWMGRLRGVDAVVHLAGASIAGARWTPSYKQLILDSRVAATRAVVAALAAVEPRPPLLISASAVGYYGDGGDRLLTEEAPPGDDFLAQVCRRWEAEAQAAETLGVRVMRLRIGLVLAREGGVLPRLAAPFRRVGGGPLGSGRQWLSWIHRDDLVRLVDFLLRRPPASGVLNAVAPDPVTNRALARALGQWYRRPAWICVPAPLVRAVAGEMGEALLLHGQRAIPRQALAWGFRYRFPTLHAALADLLGEQ